MWEEAWINNNGDAEDRAWLRGQELRHPCGAAGGSAEDDHSPCDGSPYESGKQRVRRGRHAEAVVAEEEKAEGQSEPADIILKDWE